MTSISTAVATDEAMNRKYLYLAGVNVSHSVAQPMHNYIADSLGLPWTFINQECATVEEMIRIFRQPNFAGGVVTMPYKKAVIPFLDEIDPIVKLLGACNNVYLTQDNKLRGTNTDWRGVKGCLLSGTPSGANTGRDKPALIIGAGGASRAAVYALFVELECAEIYVINRDPQEVADLFNDARSYNSSVYSRQPKITHVTSLLQAQNLKTPYYVVGTIPDFEPSTKEELEIREILDSFLGRNEEDRGVLLDMCFKPRVTRILKLGAAHGWKTVEGIDVIGHQIGEQWKLWADAGLGSVKAVPQSEAWAILNKAAGASKAINF